MDPAICTIKAKINQNKPKLKLLNHNNNANEYIKKYLTYDLYLFLEIHDIYNRDIESFCWASHFR